MWWIIFGTVAGLVWGAVLGAFLERRKWQDWWQWRQRQLDHDTELIRRDADDRQGR